MRTINETKSNNVKAKYPREGDILHGYRQRAVSGDENTINREERSNAVYDIDHDIADPAPLTGAGPPDKVRTNSPVVGATKITESVF